jgi:hypothetical protein
MSHRSRSILDLRAWRSREDRQLAITIILFLVIVGGTAIGLVYGWSVAAGGVLCLAAGAGIFGGMWLALGWLERWLARED